MDISFGFIADDICPLTFLQYMLGLSDNSFTHVFTNFGIHLAKDVNSTLKGKYFTLSKSIDTSLISPIWSFIFDQK